MKYLSLWVLYNTPVYADAFLNIIMGIIDPNAIHLLTKYNKDESEILIKELLDKGEDTDIYNV